MLLYKNNIKIFIAVIVSGLLTVGIIKYWQYNNHLEDQLLVKNFQLVLNAMSMGDETTVKNQSLDLIKFGNRTPYPRLAALFLAKIAFNHNDLELAEKNLNFVVQQHKKDPIWHIANLRLIKILLLQNKLPAVEKIKDNMQHDLPKSFASKYQELFGDLLLAKNDKQQANLLYQEAIKNLPEYIPSTLLDFKINSINIEND